MPPRWLRRDHDPFDDVDWATFGRTIGGRITALDDDHRDLRAERRWREGGPRPPPTPWPRWQWLSLAGVLLAEAACFVAFFIFIHAHMH
jgi:hypothetical protein